MLAAGVHAEEERVWAGEQVIEIFEAIGLAGGDHVEGDEGAGFVGGDAAVFLEPLLLIEALGAGAGEKLLGRF